MAKETQAEIQSKLHEVKAKLEAKKKEFDIKQHTRHYIETVVIPI